MKNRTLLLLIFITHLVLITIPSYSKPIAMRYTFIKDENRKVTHLIQRNGLSAVVRTSDMNPIKIEIAK